MVRSRNLLAAIVTLIAAVACRSATQPEDASLSVATRTVGIPQKAAKWQDQYELFLCNTTEPCYVRHGVVGLNDTLLWAGLHHGGYFILVSDVANNCTVKDAEESHFFASSPWLREIWLEPGESEIQVFDVACT